MLNVTQFTKKFDTKIAVDEISFEIKEGEIYSLIGPNSSGKTTIVRSIVGLLAIDEGNITVAGKDITQFPVETKSVIGYIPDEPSIWSSVTGEEFLHFTGALYGMTSREREKRIEELLPVFSLEEIKDEYFENYSRGNKQKFSIIAALLHNPKLLLVDEPIVGLDPESAAIAKKQFVQFKERGGAVLLVTHTLSVAQEIASRIGVMREGNLLAEGTLEILREKAKLGSAANLESVYTALTKK